MADVPEYLPHLLYLLAYDADRQRLTGRLELRYLISAGALTELLLAGHIADEGGKVVARGTAEPADPILGELYREIARSSPHSWRRWLSKGSRTLPRQIRDALADRDIVRLEHRRIIGPRIRVPDVLAVKRLGQRVSTALSDSRPASRVAPRDAALVALAAHAELKTVMPRARQRAHRLRIAELSEVAEPVPQALTRAIRQARAAASGS